MPGFPRYRCRRSEPRPRRCACVPATPLRSSTRRARRGQRRVCAVRRRSCSGGAFIRRGRLVIREGDVLFTTLPLFHTNALNAFYQALLNGCTLRAGAEILGLRLLGRRCNGTMRRSAYLLGAMAVDRFWRSRSCDDCGIGFALRSACGVPPQIHGPLPPAVWRAAGRRLWVDRDELRVRRARSPVGSSGNDGLSGRRHRRRGIVDDMFWRFLMDRPDELALRAARTLCFCHRLFRHAGEDGRGLAESWFHSGDRVVRDADGHYRFIDRMKDLIRRRGENVSSWEVEQNHPSPIRRSPLAADLPAAARSWARTRLRLRSCWNRANRWSPSTSSGTAKDRSPISPSRAMCAF